MRNYHSASVIRILSKYGMNKEASSVFIKNAEEEEKTVTQAGNRWNWDEIHSIVADVLDPKLRIYFASKTKDKPEGLRIQLEKIINKLNDMLGSDVIDEKQYTSQMSSEIIDAVASFNLQEKTKKDEPAPEPTEEPKEEENIPEDIEDDDIYEEEPLESAVKPYPPRDYTEEESLNEALLDYDDNLLDAQQDTQQYEEEKLYNRKVYQAQKSVLGNPKITGYVEDKNGNQHIKIQQGWVQTYRDIAVKFYDTILPDIAHTAVMYYFRGDKFDNTRVNFDKSPQNKKVDWIKSMIIEPDYETMNLWGKGEVGPEVHEKKFKDMIEKMPLTINQEEVKLRAREILLDYDNAKDGISVRQIVMDEHAMPAPDEFPDHMKETLEKESKRVLNMYLPTDLKHLPRADFAVKESPLYRPNMHKVLSAIESELKKYIKEYESQVRALIIKDWENSQEVSKAKAQREATVIQDKRFVPDDLVKKDSNFVKDIKENMALKQGPKIEEVAKQLYQEAKAKGVKLYSRVWTWQEDVPIKNSEGKAGKTTKRFVGVAKINPDNSGTIELTIREQKGGAVFVEGSLLLLTVKNDKDGKLVVSEVKTIDNAKQIADTTFESSAIFRLNVAINKVIAVLREDKTKADFTTILKNHRDLVLEELMEMDKMGTAPAELKAKYTKLIEDVLPPEQKQSAQESAKTARVTNIALNKLAYKQALQSLRDLVK